MNSGSEADQYGSRPATARSTHSSNYGSMASLKAFFSNKRIYPVVADVVYGTGEETSQNIEVTKQTSAKSYDVTDEESQRCCMRFSDMMKRAYELKKKADIKTDPEKFLKTTFRALFLYMIFLSLLIIIAFGMTSPNKYYYTASISSNIFNYKFADGSGSFANIGSMDDFWKYLEGPLMKSLFWNTWYNNYKNGTWNNEGRIYYDDIVVGVAQLRLLRVKTNSCSIPSVFASRVVNCYDQYTIEDSDHSTFGLGNDSAWIYSETSDGSSYPYSGQIGTYESGGFKQILTRDQPSSFAIIKYLKANRWLTRNTRAVIIDYTLYNPNIDLFCGVKLVVEFPPTGGAFANADLRATKLIRYVSAFDYFVMCSEALFVLFVIFYILEESVEIYKHRSRYFVELWNVIDVFVVIISLSCILLNMYRSTLANSKIDSLLGNQYKHADFNFAYYWQKIYNEAICINVFLAWIKIFKYISFSKSMTQFTDTMSRSVKELIGFTIMFCIVFMAFSQCAYILFSSKIKDYRIFKDSVFALFRIILADFNFNAIYNANTLLGPLFFITYIFFVFFILLSMFIAIIYDSYMDVKEDLNNMKENFHIGQFLKRQVMSRLRKEKVVKIQDVLEKGEIMNKEQLSYQDWRKELQLHGYADVEIQAIFMKYDEDGDRVLDYDERNKMLQDIKDRKMNIMGQIMSNDDDADDDSSEEEEEFVTEEQMRELVERVNNVESGLLDIVRKLDRVLECLAESEKSKLDHQKNIRVSLNILTGSSANLRM